MELLRDCRTIAAFTKYRQKSFISGNENSPHDFKKMDDTIPYRYNSAG